MEAGNSPGVLTVGISSSHTEDVVKLVTSSDNLAKPKLQDNCLVYHWHIDNKYYTADVQLYLPISKDIYDKNFVTCLEAVIFYIDNYADDFTSELNHWVHITNKFELNIKILALNCVLPEEERDCINRWCIQNEFECIELKPTYVDDHKICGNDDGNIAALDRLVEALHAHHWSNLKLKDAQRSLKLAEAEQTNNDGKSEKTCKPRNSNRPEYSAEIHYDELDELSLLFRNLQSLKKEVSSLSGTEKLDQAEKVVKAFWNAVGGDSDEFSDSTDEAS